MIRLRSRTDEDKKRIDMTYIFLYLNEQDFLERVSHAMAM